MQRGGGDADGTGRHRPPVPEQEAGKALFPVKPTKPMKPKTECRGGDLGRGGERHLTKVRSLCVDVLLLCLAICRRCSTPQRLGRESLRVVLNCCFYMASFYLGSMWRHSVCLICGRGSTGVQGIHGGYPSFAPEPVERRRRPLFVQPCAENYHVLSSSSSSPPPPPHPHPPPPHGGYTPPRPRPPVWYSRRWWREKGGQRNGEGDGVVETRDQTSSTGSGPRATAQGGEEGGEGRGRDQGLTLGPPPRFPGTGAGSTGNAASGEPDASLRPTPGYGSPSQSDQGSGETRRPI